jgi:hypothetical protein
MMRPEDTVTKVHFPVRLECRKDVRDSHSNARRKHVEKLLLFAEEIKWPCLDKLRGHILPKILWGIEELRPAAAHNQDGGSDASTFWGRAEVVAHAWCAEWGGES